MKKPWIDPELRSWVETAPQSPPLNTDTLDIFRATNLPIEPERFFPNAKRPVVHIVEGLENAVEVYEFRPSTPKQSQAALLWLHGGGFVVGHGNDQWFGPLFAECAGVRVFSVNYRLAPEHPYPAALEDAWTVLNWIASQAETLEIEPERIAIGGASAGGGLAAGLAINNRDMGGPKVAFQLLLYPMLDNRHDTASGRMDVPRWPRESSLMAWSMYLGGQEPSDAAVPATADDLSRLPPAFLSVGEADLFLDEVRSYAARLVAAHVPCTLKTYKGVFHAADMIGYDTRIGRQMSGDYLTALMAALASGGQ